MTAEPKRSKPFQPQKIRHPEPVEGSVQPAFSSTSPSLPKPFCANQSLSASPCRPSCFFSDILDDFAVAFFKIISDYQPKGHAIFSCAESPKAHVYAERGTGTPWKPMGYVILGLMILLWTWFIVWILNLNWSNLGLMLMQTHISWSGYFFIAWCSLIILANLFYPRSAYDHVFYGNVAKIYSGPRKRPYRWILPHEIEYFEAEKVNYEQEVFYMITVRFKSSVPKFLGRPCNLRFGVNEQGDIQKLADWATERGIPLRADKP